MPLVSCVQLCAGHIFSDFQIFSASYSRNTFLLLLFLFSPVLRSCRKYFFVLDPLCSKNFSVPLEYKNPNPIFFYIVCEVVHDLHPSVAIVEKTCSQNCYFYLIAGVGIIGSS